MTNIGVKEFMKVQLNLGVTFDHNIFIELSFQNPNDHSKYTHTPVYFAPWEVI